MILRIHPGKALRGIVNLPGDKSLSHRAALLSALAEGESRIENFLEAGVTGVMLEALTDLGVVWELEEAVLRVEGMGWEGLRAPARILECGHSATTMRFLAGALAGAGLAAVLDGSAALRRRPMGRVIEPLRKMGACIEAAAGGVPPLLLNPRPAESSLCALKISLDVASAQVKTAILLAGLQAEGETIIHEPGPSRDHTERLLSSMGVAIDRSVQGCLRMQPPSTPLRPLVMRMPGDFSSAAFLIVAGLITPGSNLTLKQVGLNPTRTGLLEALKAMGAWIEIRETSRVNEEPIGDIHIRHSTLRGVEIAGDQVVRMIDEFPAFAVAAAYAQGRTVVRDAAELRYKESDRISGLCMQLGALGINLKERSDGFTVEGNGRPAGGRADSLGDHRLAMSLSVAGLAAGGPVSVAGAEIIGQSYPLFESTLRQLGGQVERCPENATVSA